MITAAGGFGLGVTFGWLAGWRPGRIQSPRVLVSLLCWATPAVLTALWMAAPPTAIAAGIGCGAGFLIHRAWRRRLGRAGRAGGSVEGE